MEILKRGLTKDFVDALNTAANESAWWKSMVDDRELFVTPRKSCVCVYYRGNRLLKLELDSEGRLVGEIHYKYVLNPSLPHPYWGVRDGRVERPDGVGAFIPNFSNLDLLKRASKAYAGDEKYGVSEIIAANPNIIDTEVAFSDPAHPSDPAHTDEPDDLPPEETVVSKSHHNPRIDFVALQKNGTGLKLVFFEAKHFTNPELKSKGDPRVFEQIDNYEKLLENNKKDLVVAYRLHCADMLNSNCVPEGSAKHAADGTLQRRDFLSKVLGGQVIEVNTKPRLIVFGFDDDGKRGRFWKAHEKKLEEHFGADRVILRGSATGLVKGVRFQEP